MTIQVDHITLPACWASALVNDDYSGLQGDEIRRCSEQVATLADDGWRIVDVARYPEDKDGHIDAIEQRFTWHYQLYDSGAEYSGGDVLDYVLHRTA